MSTSASPETSPFGFSTEMEVGRPLNERDNKLAWIVFGGFILCLIAAYWNMLSFTSTFWDDDLYSHGWIVPVFAGVLFWLRSQARLKLSSIETQVTVAIVCACVGLNLVSASSGFALPSWLALLEVMVLVGVYIYHVHRTQLTQVTTMERWIGVGILAASLLIRLYASYYDMNPLDRLSFIGAILGVCQMVGGTHMLRWAGPPIGFLVFMFPLPSRLEGPILLTLQKIAAISSEWTLQLIGAPALREGNKIIIDQVPLDVADACSGLRMGTIFGAMAVAMAMIINRPWWDRVTILLSAIPIALLTNVIRITVTALLYMAFPESEMVKHFVHDWAGFAMMPIALGFLWLELQLLSRITVPVEVDDYAAFGAAHG